MPDGVDGFGSEVPTTGKDFVVTGFVIGDVEHGGNPRPVTPEQAFDQVLGKIVFTSESRRGVLPGFAPGICADQRDLVGVGTCDRAVEIGNGGVDGVGRHHPVGRVLAAGDRDQPVGGLSDGMLAAELGGVVAFAGDEGTKTGVDAHDIGAGEWCLERCIRLLE